MDIFVINTSDTDNIKPELLEAFRHKEFKNKLKEKEHCLAYLMLDRILREVYKIQSRDIEFINGKPYLKSKEKFFSISHSKEYIVIAISDNECGVDIEKIVNRDYEAIANRMKFSCTSLEDFYIKWTKYEAEYKLNKPSKSIKNTKFDEYIITAVSEYDKETYEIYIQNGEQFPNL